MDAKRKVTGRWLVGAVGGFLLLGALIHLPMLRPALVHAGVFSAQRGASCPFGYSAASSVAELKAQEAQRHAQHRGPRAAKGTYALGFRLDQDRLTDLQSWAQKEGVTCATKHGGHLFSCDELRGTTQLPNGAAISARSLWFEIGSRGTLASLKVLRQDAAVAPVAKAFAQAETDVTTHAGVPTQRTGEATPSALSAGSLSQAAAEYRYSDYYAVLRATNMNGHYLLTEEYASLRDT